MTGNITFAVKLKSATPGRGATRKGSRGEGRASESRGLRRGYPLLDLGLRKTHLCRGIIAWRAILSDESDESDGSDGANDTGCVSGRDPPPRVPIPQGAVYRSGVQLDTVGEFFYRY